LTANPQVPWTFAITSIAVFVVTLDNLAVTTACAHFASPAARAARRR
jgi:hypothetical protein